MPHCKLQRTAINAKGVCGAKKINHFSEIKAYADVAPQSRLRLGYDIKLMLTEPRSKTSAKKSTTTLLSFILRRVD
jgi:hypothetical protein